MKSGLVRVWFLAVVFLLAEIGSCQQATSSVTATNRIAGLVQRIQKGNEGFAPVLSLIQVAAETVNQVIAKRGSRDEMLGVISALQLGESNETLSVTQTFVETFFNMNEKTDRSRVTNSMAWLNLLLISVAFVAFLAFSTGIIGAIQIFADNVRKRSSNTVQVAYWGIFMLMSGFVALTATETSVWNRFLMYFGELMWGSDSSSSSIDAVFGMQTSSGVSLGSTASLGAGASLSADMSLLANITEPVFCDAAYTPGNIALNRYPRGSIVYEYNRRRLAGTSVEEFPELQYIQSLLDDPNYPPTAGGISSTMARAFGGISNECDEFNGDIAKCCDDANCQLAADPQLCMQQRCPGKVLYEHGGGQHCRCLEMTSKLGLQVEFKQLSLCGSQAQDWIKTNIAQVKDAEVRQAAAAVVGCSGNYDASSMTVSGPASQLVYSLSSFSDKSSWGASSLYVQLNNGADPTSVRVQLPLSSCTTGAKNHFFRIRHSNPLSTPLTMSLFFDDVPAGTVTFPAAKSTNSLSTEAVFRIPAVLPGDHVVALAGNAGGMPAIHRIAVCTDSDDFCASVFA